LAKYIDQTNVEPNATGKDIKKICQEGKKFNFHFRPAFAKASARRACLADASQGGASETNTGFNTLYIILKKQSRRDFSPALI